MTDRRRAALERSLAVQQVRAWERAHAAAPPERRFGIVASGNQIVAQSRVHERDGLARVRGPLTFTTIELPYDDGPDAA